MNPTADPPKMAQQIYERDISSTLAAAKRWIGSCLVKDGSILSTNALWTPQLIDEVHRVFVDHPDLGPDDFITKLKGQMRQASVSAQQLVAEMLWALLLFPSNIKARSKRTEISELWAMSGKQLSDKSPMMADDKLAGIGGEPCVLYQTTQ